MNSALFVVHRFSPGAAVCARSTAVSLFVALLIGLSVPAAGQTSANGAIRGHVRDPTGAVLPETAITVSSSTAPTPFTVVSDGEGYYRLLELPPGEYELTAERPRFAKFARAGITVRAGLNLAVDIDLVLGNQTDTITVRADTPMLESSSAVQAVNIDGEFQRHVPLTSRRDWADSLLLVPGVVATTQAGSNKVFYYLHGSDFSSLVLQIDGADVASTLQNTNSYVNLSTEAIQDVQVKTGAIDASTPIGAGAILSVVTQSGTNRLKGAAGIVYQGESWNGNNTPGGTSSAFEIVQPDVSLGGPVIENRAWFFGAYRYTNNSLGVSRTDTQIANLRALVPGFRPLAMDTDASYFFAKATAALTPSHHLEAFWQRDHSPENFVAPTWGGAFLKRDFGGTGIGVKLSSAWKDALTTRANVSFNDKGIRAELPYDDRPSRNVHQGVFSSGGRLLGTGTLVVLDTLPSAPDQPADKLTLSADATWFRDSTGGSHELQAGLYLQPRLHERTTQHYTNGGYALEEVVLRDPSNPAAGVIPFHRQIYDAVNVPSRWADGHDYAVYVQDAWRPLARLTVNAGVRADFIGRKDAAFDVETENSTEIGPRVGVNYLLTHDGRQSVRASWTRVADVLAQTTQSAGSNVSGFRDVYDNNLDGVFETTFVTPGVSAQSTDRVLDDARHQPHTNEWIAGYRQQLPGLVSVDASVVRREFRDRTALVEINGIYDGGVFRGYRNEAFNDIYKITNNIWNWPVYTFLELQATKQTDRFQAIGSYTHQWRHLAGTWQPNDPASFIQPDAFPNSKGIGSVSNTFESQNSLSSSSSTSTLQVPARDHTIRLGAIYRGPLDTVFATNYTFQSGVWSGPITTRLAAPDPRFGPPTVTLSNGRVVSNPLATTIRFANATRDEGQFALPAMHLVNLRIGKDIRFGARRVEAALDVFNVANHDAFYLLEVGANQTFSPFFGQGRQRLAPRAAQISARYVF
jgi:hypothetical protein